jgi:ribosomal protein S18 acetylase RimI-like enzyme
MKTIEYIETDRDELDTIGFLWEKLKEHHRERSLHYAGHFSGMTWDKRKQDLLNKSRQGALRLDIARDNQTGKIVGYCISTITEDKQGEIDSIYVESSYRRQGIGDCFLKKALAWMDCRKIERKVIAVAAGNEEVIPFYARYGFYPRVTCLRQVDS